MEDQGILNKKLSELGVPPMALLAVIGISDDLAKYYNVLID